MRILRPCSCDECQRAFRAECFLRAATILACAIAATVILSQLA